GLGLTGNPTGVLLTDGDYEALPSLLSTAIARRLSLVVIVAFDASNKLSPVNTLAAINAPSFLAHNAQSLVDLSIGARAIAMSARHPVVIACPAVRALGEWTKVVLPSPLPALEAGPEITYYQQEIAGQAAWPATLDTQRPTGSGFNTSEEISGKQSLGRNLFLHKALPALLKQALSELSQHTGRPYAAVNTPSKKPSSAVIVASGMVHSGVSSEVVRVLQIQPFPDEELAACLTGIKTVGVLIDPSAIVPDQNVLILRIRAASLKNRKGGTTRKWSFHPQSSEPVDIVPIVYSERGLTSPSVFEKLHSRLSDETRTASTLILNEKPGSANARLPHIEQAIQRMRKAGVVDDEIEYVAPPAASEAKSLIVMGTPGEDVWPTLKQICTFLSDVGLGDIRASAISAEGMQRPVLGFVHTETNLSERVPVLCSSRKALSTQEARRHIPEGATVLIPEAPLNSGKLPFWMTEKSLDVRQFDATLGQSVPDLLRRAISTLPKLTGDILSANGLDVEPRGNLTECPVAEFATVLDSPPEVAPSADLADRGHGGAPVSDPVQFWQSLGQLSRKGRISEAVVEPILTSGMLPAMTAPLIAGGLPETVCPTVIPERCTGCGDCWAVCPESAVVVRAYSVESLWNQAILQAGTKFVHLKRLAAAVLKTAHALIREDILHNFSSIGLLFSESFTRVMDQAGLAGERRDAIEKEIDIFLSSISELRPIRTEDWFEKPEKSVPGSGSLLSIAVDPSACNNCGACLKACAEDAMEIPASLEPDVSWPQIAALGTLPQEQDAHLASLHSTAPLIGKTSTHVFRPVSTDVGNLNRTAIRLFLEALHHASANKIRSVLDRLDGVIDRIDQGMQTTLSSGVKVNDFEQFSRQLQQSEKGLEQHFNDGKSRLTERLSLLAKHRLILSQERDQFGDRSKISPHFVLVDGLQTRNAGLADYPANPFAMPYLKSGREHIAGLLNGISSGLSGTYARLASNLRIAESLLDDVYDEGSTPEITPEDRAWARKYRPEIALLMDVPLSGSLTLLDLDLGVRTLMLSDGTDRPEVRAFVRAAVASDLVRVGSLTVAQPGLLFGELRNGMQFDGPVLFQVYAPDPVQDGFPASDALHIARLSETCGIVQPFTHDPASGTSHLPSTLSSHFTPADWLVRQHRFDRLFEQIPSSEKASDQIVLSEWLTFDSEGRSKTRPVVDVAQKGSKASRFGIIEAGVEVVESILDQKTDTTAKVHAKVDVPDHKKPAIEVVSESAIPDPAPDESRMLESLTEKLLALSGFRDSDVHFLEWIKDNTVETTE
ncbi:4Fe-4S binding protein, partial [bacterium]|nr:4Fe-4S binding protein [bacterium]